MALDIERFGSPSNFDAGPQESGLRFWAKLPAITSQTRGYNTFAVQVAARTYEFQCVSKALRLNGLVGVRDKNLGLKDEEEEDDEEPRLGRTRYRVYANTPQGTVNPSEPGVGHYQVTKAFRKNSCKAHFAISPVVEDFLRWQPQEEHDKIFVQELDGEIFWEFRTEVSIVLKDRTEGTQRVKLRCHPNYRNEGPWYDWVVVNFDSKEVIFQRDNASSKRRYLRNGGKEEEWDPIEGSTQQYDDSCIPCKVLAIAQNPKDEKDVRLLVHGCQYRTDNKQTEFDTVLLEFWQLAYHDLYDHLPKAWRDNRRRNSRNPKKDLPHKAPQLSWIKLDTVVTRCLVVEEDPGIFETVPLSPKGDEKNWVMLLRPHIRWATEFTGNVA